jgi:hypothetical protein
VECSQKNGKKIHIQDLERDLLPLWADCMAHFMRDVTAEEDSLKNGRSWVHNGPAAKTLVAPAGIPQISREILDYVNQDMIDNAISNLDFDSNQQFADPGIYDLILPSGQRIPLNAILGIALSQALGRTATPLDLAAISGQRCVEIVEDAGYPVVSKNELFPSLPPEADDERIWAEGFPKRVTHLRRERAPGLAKTKKKRFMELHGRLYCERCNLVPSQSLGPFGDACIEVHHSKITVAQMDGKTLTRLADLECLCANCHRIVHREQSKEDVLF